MNRDQELIRQRGKKGNSTVRVRRELFTNWKSWNDYVIQCELTVKRHDVQPKSFPSKKQKENNE